MNELLELANQQKVTQLTADWWGGLSAVHVMSMAAGVDTPGDLSDGA